MVLACLNENNNLNDDNDDNENNNLIKRKMHFKLSLLNIWLGSFLWTAEKRSLFCPIKYKIPDCIAEAALVQNISASGLLLADMCNVQKLWTQPARLLVLCLVNYIHFRYILAVHISHSQLPVKKGTKPIWYHGS